MLIFNYKRFYSNINGAIDNYKKGALRPLCSAPKYYLTTIYLFL